MSKGIAIGSRRIGSGALILVLLGLALAAALLTPEAQRDRGGASSRSSGPSGARIAYELARRMGWIVARRDAPLDSLANDTTVQVVIGPEQALGAHEVHRLLDNVRRGGGLVFDVDGGSEIADSLGIALRIRGDLLIGRSNDCPRRTAFGERRAASLPPTVHRIVWRRPPPGPVAELAFGFGAGAKQAIVGVGFPLGRGRIAAVSSSEAFANDAVRTCEWAADVAVARAFEYVRADDRAVPLVFDEYHHGYGVHAGSVSAVASYLSRTGSGRFLATLLAAGVLLLFAVAPRPIVPRDPPLIARRSPLEHADALGRAYADVDATRTATARLVGGVRRRAGRTVPLPANADDLAFLDAVARRSPSLAVPVATVRRGLTETIAVRDLAPIGAALAAIEHTLSTTPPRTP